MRRHGSHAGEHLTSNVGNAGAERPKDRVNDEEDEDVEDLLMALLTRKEVSVAWKDTSLPHLVGYGSILYIVEQLLMYPSDLLKTRLQVSRTAPRTREPNLPLASHACGVLSAAAHPRQVDMRHKTDLNKDWLRLCRHIRSTEGYRGFFRGFVFNTAAGIPAQIAYLVTYNWCKEAVENMGGKQWKESPIAPLCAGALAEGITSVVRAPLSQPSSARGAVRARPRRA
jgi:hypothetical protein